MSRVHMAVERGSTSEGLREIARREASALLASELGRQQEEWRGALTSVTNTLAGLVSACERTVSAADDDPTAAVSQLVERLVTAAAADARTSTQHIEAQAQADAAEAQALIDRLQSEIRAGQEQLRTAREQLHEAHNARAQAESTAEKLQAVHTQATSGLQSQLRNTEAELSANRAEVSALKQQLGAGQEERANLIATLESVQRAVHRAVSAIEPGQSRPSPSPPSTAPHQNGADEVLGCVVPSAAVPSAAPSLAPSVSVSTEVPDAGSSGGIGDYAATLLRATETTYWADMKMALPPSEVVDRLTDNLRHASDLFMARFGSDRAGENSFMSQLTKLLEAKSGTSFGRHLSIAANEAERHVVASRGMSPGRRGL